MTRGSLLGLLVLAFTLFGCAGEPAGRADAGWVLLFEGKNLDHWTRVGDANWRIVDGVLETDKGMGFLVSKQSYENFEIRAEVWISADGNTGIFLRCTDPVKISSTTAYEANVFDARPDPTYGTGAINPGGPVNPMPRGANRWNTMVITAEGPRLTFTFNGIRTVDMKDTRFPRGPIALQAGGGVVKFRRVEIRPL